MTNQLVCSNISSTISTVLARCGLKYFQVNCHSNYLLIQYMPNQWIYDIQSNEFCNNEQKLVKVANKIASTIGCTSKLSYHSDYTVADNWFRYEGIRVILKPEHFSNCTDDASILGDLVCQFDVVPFRSDYVYDVEMLYTLQEGYKPKYTEDGNMYTKMVEHYSTEHLDAAEFMQAVYGNCLPGLSEWDDYLSWEDSLPVTILNGFPETWSSNLRYYTDKLYWGQPVNQPILSIKVRHLGKTTTLYARKTCDIEGTSCRYYLQDPSCKAEVEAMLAV